MSLTLSPMALAKAHAAVCALLDGGTLELFDGHTKLVTVTLAGLSESGLAAPMAPAYGLAKGTPDRIRCLSARGELVASGPATGIAITPKEILPGARITVDRFALTGS